MKGVLFRRVRALLFAAMAVLASTAFQNVCTTSDSFEEDDGFSILDIPSG